MHLPPGSHLLFYFVRFTAFAAIHDSTILISGSMQKKDVTQITLRAYSDKPHGLHGFLNELAESLRHLVGSVQSAKEIGIIEEKQVINIIDSVVQRTRFGGAGVGAVLR